MAVSRIDMSGYGAGGTKPKTFGAPGTQNAYRAQLPAGIANAYRAPGTAGAYSRPPTPSPTTSRAARPQASMPTAPRIASNPLGQISTTSVQSGAVAPPPAPSVPSIDEFLGSDTGYQEQVAALQKAMADYQGQMGQQKSQYGVDYSAKVNELGFNKDRNAAGGAYKDALRGTENDFASRGLLNSGLFGQADADVTNQFGRRQGDLDRAQSDFLSGLEQAFTNFQSEQGLTSQRAKNEAIARRAAQYGV